jgi:hypothetical protein
MLDQAVEDSRKGVIFCGSVVGEEAANLHVYKIGMLRRRYGDNIKMHTMKTQLQGVNWIYPARDTNQWRDPVNTVLNLRVR